MQYFSFKAWSVGLLLSYNAMASVSDVSAVGMDILSVHGSSRSNPLSPQRLPARTDDARQVTSSNTSPQEASLPLAPQPVGPAGSLLFNPYQVIYDVELR